MWNGYPDRHRDRQHRDRLRCGTDNLIGSTVIIQHFDKLHGVRQCREGQRRDREHPGRQHAGRLLCIKEHRYRLRIITIGYHTE